MAILQALSRLFGNLKQSGIIPPGLHTSRYYVLSPNSGTHDLMFFVCLAFPNLAIGPPYTRPPRSCAWLQVDTLTELCLAFESTISRESIIAALTASNHDATSAAQLLLDPGPANSRERREGRRSRLYRGVAQRERKARPLRTDGSLPTATLLGATCGVDHKAGALGGRGWEEEEEDAEGEEEEEMDEGLSSEEYRTRANAAAEEMKAWFQKAAEAFTKGGR